MSDESLAEPQSEACAGVAAESGAQETPSDTAPSRRKRRKVRMQAHVPMLEIRAYAVFQEAPMGHVRSMLTLKSRSYTEATNEIAAAIALMDASERAAWLTATVSLVAVMAEHTFESRVVVSPVKVRAQ